MSGDGGPTSSRAGRACGAERLYNCRMTRKLIDDCFVSDKPRLRHAEAIAILKGRIGPVAETELVGLSEAAGRILAEAAAAPLPVPAHTNAAVDGYSFAAAEYDRERGCELPVAGRAAAGHA